MRANRIEYLFSVNTHTPPTITVDSGEEFTVEVRGAFDDVEDISAVPTPFTPACDGHPLAPIAGPIVVRGARTGLGREEAYMLLSIIGELRVGTSPRPVMATRLIVPEEQLRAAGWDGELP